MTFTLTETGNDTVTASATGNQVTGYIDQYDTVSDGYTMTDTGTRTGGAFSEVVTGSETYQDQETGTPQQGNYSVYETGSGTFDRTDDGPGATLPPQFGTTGYTLTETYSSPARRHQPDDGLRRGPLFAAGSLAGHVGVRGFGRRRDRHGGASAVWGAGGDGELVERAAGRR